MDLTEDSSDGENSEDSTYNEPKFLIQVPLGKTSSCYCSEKYMCDTCFCEQKGISKEELKNITEPFEDSNNDLLRIL